MGSKNKPHFLVYGRTLAGEHWKKLGVAWRSTARDKNKTSFVKIHLDFMPTTGELTLWKVEDRADDLEPDDEKFDSRGDLAPTIVEEAD